MSRNVRITVLVEDTARKQGLIGEHGLSFLIEFGRHRVLFDTGQGQALGHNASSLGLDLARVEAIVLSHGHYDHTGGLRFAFNWASHAKLYLHPKALIPRFTDRDGSSNEIGLASITERDLREDESRLVWTCEPTQVVPGVWVTGEIPRLNDYEDTGGRFYLDAASRQPDPILDDQALYLDTPDGVIALLGCAHAGAINTLNYMRRITGRSIHAVMGGTHLINASTQRIDQTIAALREMQIRLLAPAHCTGPMAMAALWTAFADRVADCSTGCQWEFQR